MGYYINPEVGTKEEWLTEHGDIVAGIWPPAPDRTLVCLVGNPMFTAAAIAYSQDERDQFADHRDTRTKVWYAVPTEKIIEVCPAVESKLI